MTKLGKYCILFCFILANQLVIGQSQKYLLGLDSTLAKVFPDSVLYPLSADSAAFYIQEYLFSQSYLLASCDSITREEKGDSLFFYAGPKVSWMIPSIDSVGLELLKLTGEQIPQGLMSSTELLNWRTSILRSFSARAYPFMKFYLEDIRFNGDTLLSTLKIEQGPQMRLNRIEIYGDVSISPVFLGRMLGLEVGQAFDIGSIAALEQKLTLLPYLEQERGTEVDYDDGRLVLRFYLKKKNASRLNILLGIIPGGNIPGSRLTLTGLADVQVRNSLGQGEFLAFKFERLQTQTQTIDLEASFPYLLDLPFGLEGNMHQSRRDSSFNQVSGDISALAYFRGLNSVKVFIGWEQSNLLSLDEGSLISQRRLPTVLDTRSRNYGVGVNMAKLDYLYNPRRGFELNSRTTFSQRRIVPNSAISSLIDENEPDFDFSTLYTEELIDPIILLKQELTVGTYVPFGNRSVIKFGVDLAYQYAGRAILRNEQWIIGGINSLRGFNEGLLFADSYLMSSLEYRFILDKNSYLSAYSDLARLWQGKQFLDHLGLGVGLNFEVSTGIFGISIAVGKQGDAPFDLSSPKVHFGFVNQF